MVAAIKKKVLIVDDNADAGLTLQLLIRSSGHDAVYAQTGHAALALAQTFRPDIALVDLVLPDIDGLDLVADLRQKLGTRLRCYMLTGYGDEAARARSIGSGCDGHLVKPVAPKELDDLLDL
jgi:DNA-binding response OmpR family regulator